MKFEELLCSRERKGAIDGARMDVKERIIEVLELKGISSEKIVSRIKDEDDMDKLNKWFTMSVTAQNQDEFIKNM